MRYLPPVVAFIHEAKYDAFVYTPGELAWAQPMAQLVTPASTHTPLRRHTNGPPESPWQGTEKKTFN